MLEGEHAELTEEQIAKTKEAEEAFKVKATVACSDNASMQHALQACDITDTFTGQMVTLCDVNELYNVQSKVVQRSAVSCLCALAATARLTSNRPQPIAGGGLMHIDTHYIITASQLLRG